MYSEQPNMQLLENSIFNIDSDAAFDEYALQIFRFQYRQNPVYRQYCDLVQRTPSTINSYSAIPFLPISSFKTHKLVSSSFQEEIIFESSGTTGTINSRHWVKSSFLYEQSFTKTFNRFYGPPEDYCFLALLPSYLERTHSSLVYMVEKLMKLSGHPMNGFYLYDNEKLSATLSQLQSAEQKTFLIGVTYALLDFAEAFSMQLKNTVIMETGGMKGRRTEMIREEVHLLLQIAFGVDHIASEYGMTELLSQAYARKAGFFHCPPWMRVLIREDDDPFTVHDKKVESISGALNIIDLANIYSCSFIATEDIGRLHSDRSFEVLGRIDNSDIRGCSLLTI